jgi:zinc protease
MTKKLVKPKIKKSEPAKKSVKRLKLKNGLSVLLIENHKSPVVSVQMWVKTGSADETKQEQGISHFIEHLVFKGTEKYGVGQIASAVEAAGGELNAFTSFDQTVFYVNISHEFSDVALDVVSEMIGFPTFDKTEIDNEREVVLEEIKRSNDSPSRQASRTLFSTVFKTHPYGVPVIGFDKIVKKVSRKTLVDYYQSRYVAKNMDLVVAGSFDMADMSKKIESYFGHVKPFKLRKVTRKVELPQRSMRVKVVKAAFEEAQFHLAFRIPGASHKDIAALDVLALILGQGDSSRLSQKLRMEHPLTNSIGAGTFTPKDSGLFTISGSLNADQVEPALTALMGEIERILFIDPPTLDELRKAITNFESDEFYSMETIEGIARKAGSLENLMGDYAYFQKFMKKIYALKPEDLLKVAKKYLDADRATFVLMTPRDVAPIEKYVRNWGKQLRDLKSKKLPRPKKAVGTSKAPAIKKVKWSLGESGAQNFNVEKHVLKSGATVLFRPSHATPVFSAKAAYLGGLRIEQPENGGVTELLSRVWTSGTKDMTEAEIQRRIESIAGGISAFGGRNSTGLSMQTIAPFEDEAIEIFNEILSAPLITENIIEREKIVMLEQIRSREDNPGQLVGQLFIQSMFAGHPYERDLLGTAETVKQLTLLDVNRQLEKMAHAANLMVVVSGGVDPSRWLKRLESSTGHLAKGAPAVSHFEHKGPKKDLVTFKKLEREQSHIMIGYRGLTLSDPRRYTLQVLQSVLAGQGGRLFIELRDKASLAYSVSPMRMDGLDTGYFGAYIGCSPNKGQKAIEMLQIEFQKLADELIPSAEFERAKRFLIGRHDIDLQRNSAISSSILFNEIYGIPCSEMFEYANRLKAVTAVEVQKLAKEIFAQPKVMCAVGPVTPF